MKYPRFCSASGMFVHNNVHSFKELRRKCILYGFTQRIRTSENAIANAAYNTYSERSRLWKHWKAI